jgi:exodeoxyribonuclease V beta subunit
MVDDLAHLLETHLRADDPLAGYPARMRAAALDTQLRGFMVGAVDIVARLDARDDTRFVVIDHKTNHLGWPDDPGLPHYHPDALAAEMQDSHYVLQALIYQVALHRYLRWRLPDYDPDRHLGGAHYLFLRGITGGGSDGDADRPHGVFSWCPSPALITAASDLLDAAPVPA